jgi:predicted RNase H-like HicB family nuclease
MTLLADRIEVERTMPGYDVEIAPEQYAGGVVYIARHPDLPGCTSHGNNPDEALENLAEAREMYLHGLLRSGLEVPSPHESPRVNVLRSFVGAPRPTQTLRLAWRVVTHRGV